MTRPAGAQRENWRWRRCRRALAAVIVAFLSSGEARAQHERAEEGEPVPALVHLRDVDASILQDIRYAGADNFTGRRVPGYDAPECMLLREVAEALARVQAELRPRNLSLRVYDCYRPRRAVRAFRAWVREPEADPLLRRFHPNLDKRDLISLGYIAAVSRHSRGDAIDLTLVALPEKRVAAFKRGTAYGPCNGPAKERAPDSSIDMGTSFDCFDELSHTHAAGVSPDHAHWRRVLVDAMAKQGFRNYHKEWWHFTHGHERSGRSFDVPVMQRRH